MGLQCTKKNFSKHSPLYIVLEFQNKSGMFGSRIEIVERSEPLPLNLQACKKTDTLTYSARHVGLGFEV